MREQRDVKKKGTKPTKKTEKRQKMKKQEVREENGRECLYFCF